MPMAKCSECKGSAFRNAKGQTLIHTRNVDGKSVTTPTPFGPYTRYIQVAVICSGSTPGARP